ncbi:Serum response factor-like protein, partial [Fragariocoptes setiger]
MSVDTRKRVKVYALGAERQWNDKGTGFVTIAQSQQQQQQLACQQSMCLLVKSEDDRSIILESKIHNDTQYQKQQDKDACDDIWHKLCAFQGKDPAISLFDTRTTSSDNGAPSAHDVAMLSASSVAPSSTTTTSHTNAIIHSSLSNQSSSLVAPPMLLTSSSASSSPGSTLASNTVTVTSAATPSTATIASESAAAITTPVTSVVSTTTTPATTIVAPTSSSTTTPTTPTTPNHCAASHAIVSQGPSDNSSSSSSSSSATTTNNNMSHRTHNQHQQQHSQQHHNHNHNQHHNNSHNHSPSHGHSNHVSGKMSANSHQPQSMTSSTNSNSSSTIGNNQEHHGSNSNSKKTKGRVRIKVEFIHNKLRRYTTFSKRKTGLMKKAFELATLTGTQVMLLVASETGHVYTFATRKLQPMIISEAGKALIQTCLNSPDPPSSVVGAMEQQSQQLSHQQQQHQQQQQQQQQLVTPINDQLYQQQQQHDNGNTGNNNSGSTVAVGPIGVNDTNLTGHTTGGHAHSGANNSSNNNTQANGHRNNNNNNIDQRMSATGFEETELSCSVTDVGDLADSKQQRSINCLPIAMGTLLTDGRHQSQDCVTQSSDRTVISNLSLTSGNHQMNLIKRYRPNNNTNNHGHQSHQAASANHDHSEGDYLSPNESCARWRTLADNSNQLSHQDVGNQDLCGLVTAPTYSNSNLSLNPSLSSSTIDMSSTNSSGVSTLSTNHMINNNNNNDAHNHKTNSLSDIDHTMAALHHNANSNLRSTHSVTNSHSSMYHDLNYIYDDLYHYIDDDEYRFDEDHVHIDYTTHHDQSSDEIVEQLMNGCPGSFRGLGQVVPFETHSPSKEYRARERTQKVVRALFSTSPGIQTPNQQSQLTSRKLPSISSKNLVIVDSAGIQNIPAPNTKNKSPAKRDTNSTTTNNAKRSTSLTSTAKSNNKNSTTKSLPQAPQSGNAKSASASKKGVPKVKSTTATNKSAPTISSTVTKIKRQPRASKQWKKPTASGKNSQQQPKSPFPTDNNNNNDNNNMFSMEQANGQTNNGNTIAHESHVNTTNQNGCPCVILAQPTNVVYRNGLNNRGHDDIQHENHKSLSNTVVNDTQFSKIRPLGACGQTLIGPQQIGPQYEYKLSNLPNTSSTVLLCRTIDGRFALAAPAQLANNTNSGSVAAVQQTQQQSGPSNQSGSQTLNSNSISETRKTYDLNATNDNINYGMAPQPITDINQLMPKQCQNQTMICEGSFCIPGVKQCVCNLRTPVQFGKYCLRQLDIGVQCFVTSQCNHTIKSSVCIEQSSGQVIDEATARFKLDQWHQLNELRMKSNQALMTGTTVAPGSSSSAQSIATETVSEIINVTTPESSAVHTSSNIRPNYMRNSPYEIGYPSAPYTTTNLTSDENSRIDSLGRMIARTSPRSSSMMKSQHSSDDSLTTVSSQPINSQSSDALLSSSKTSDTSYAPQHYTTSTQSTADLNSGSRINYSPVGSGSLLDRPSDVSTTSVTSNQVQDSTSYQSVPSTDLSALLNTNAGGQRKAASRTKWPPGKCSCPPGYMFDHMMRKCLTISIHDTYCKTDLDCSQIPLTHCYQARSKCECDELYVWDVKQLACVRETRSLEEKPSDGVAAPDIEYQLPRFLFLDETTSVLVVGCCIVLGILLLLISTVRCFTSKPSSTPSTPRSRSKNIQHCTLKKSSRTTPSPVSLDTMSRPVSQLSNSNKETRGRILNYDFEQNTIYSQAATNSKASMESPNRFLTSGRATKRETTPSLPSSIESKLSLKDLSDTEDKCNGPKLSQKDEDIIDPAPIINQPHYLMRPAVKGATAPSAIAAAAAAVANRRRKDQEAKRKKRDNVSPTRSDNHD